MTTVLFFTLLNTAVATKRCRAVLDWSQEEASQPISEEKINEIIQKLNASATERRRVPLIFATNEQRSVLRMILENPQKFDTQLSPELKAIILQENGRRNTAKETADSINQFVHDHNKLPEQSVQTLEVETIDHLSDEVLKLLSKKGTQRQRAPLRAAFSLNDFVERNDRLPRLTECSVEEMKISQAYEKFRISRYFKRASSKKVVQLLGRAYLALESGQKIDTIYARKPRRRMVRTRPMRLAPNQGNRIKT